MTISAANLVPGAAASAQALQQSEVAVLNKQKNQAEAVTGKLIAGVQDSPAPRSAGHATGQALDVSA